MWRGAVVETISQVLITLIRVTDKLFFTKYITCINKALPPPPARNNVGFYTSNPHKYVYARKLCLTPFFFILLSYSFSFFKFFFLFFTVIPLEELKFSYCWSNKPDWSCVENEWT